MAKDLSIIITARNEMFLKDTVLDLIKNIRGDTDIIVGLDGAWADPPLEQHDLVNVVYSNTPLGQRGIANLAASLSQAKYLMKIDAHCSFDAGFDVKMVEAFKESGDDVTMVPIMRNLWAFDWKCYRCGWKRYQGPTPQRCEQCGDSRYIKRRMMWVGKHNPQSVSYCFDSGNLANKGYEKSDPHFQYYNDYKTRPEYKKDLEETGLTETMSLQGSCFMLTREKWWELNICGEDLGNWGNQGIEVACKTWLSGGRCLVNHNTWYAHLFRTQGGDFSFPWECRGREVQKTKDNVKDLFWNNKWDKQIRPLSWLVERFMPVKGWTNEDLQKLKDHEKVV